MENELEKVHESNKNLRSELERVRGLEDRLTKKILNMRDSSFQKYPLAFVLLTTFGLVATFYGFEKVIDTIPYFIENPHMVLFAGLLTLLVTGTLLKKLS